MVTDTPTPTPTKPTTVTDTPTPTPTRIEEHENDLGDAPDSTNHSGSLMTAYPIGGPPGVVALFSTVHDVGIGALGPRHIQPRMGPWLGERVTLEEFADMGFDEDPLNNIGPNVDRPDRDGADDGLLFPLHLPDCELTSFSFQVTFPLGAPEMDYYFNAWFDWDRSGRWGEVHNCPAAPAAEWAVQNQLIPPLGPGTYVFSSQLFRPRNPNPDEPLWLRLTLSEQPSTSKHGMGLITGFRLGETEDYYLTKPHETPTVTPTRTTETPTPTPTSTRQPGGGYVIFLPLIMIDYPIVPPLPLVLRLW